MRVTECYSISGPVPFLNVHVERDNQLFLDPSAIRNATDARSQQAQRLLVTYFAEVIRLRGSTNPAELAHGRAMLAHLREPKENRLGYSKNKIGGHAIGPGIADNLWEVLDSNRAAASAALHKIEHLPLFILNVAEDLISDLTTRIIYPILAQFTTEMMHRYPAMNNTTSTTQIGVYHSVDHTWRDQPFTLPHVAGHPLLLTPKEWVYWRMLMYPEAFYNNFATTSIQDENRTYDERGKPQAPSKAWIKTQYPDHKSLNTDRAAYHKTQGRDLVLEYQHRVDLEFSPLTDAEVEQRTPNLAS